MTQKMLYKYILLILCLGWCSSYAQAQGSQKLNENEFLYQNDLHIVYTSQKSNAIMPEGLEAEIEASIKRAEASWENDPRLTDEDKESRKEAIRKAITESKKPEIRECELWIKENKWVLVVNDPSVEPDEITGTDSGKTVWWSDGSYIVKAKNSGYSGKCRKQGSDADWTMPDNEFIPAIPTLGINYGFVYTAKTPHEPMSKTPVEGWTIALCPTYRLLSGPEVMHVGAPSPMYSPGYVKIEQTNGHDFITEVCHLSPKHPAERWRFEDYRLIGDHYFAFKNTIEAYTGEYNDRLASSWVFEVESIETEPIDSSIFELSNYLHDGVELSEQLGEEKDGVRTSGARLLQYNKGVPLGQTKQSKIGLNYLLYSAVGVSSIACIYFFRKQLLKGN